MRAEPNPARAAAPGAAAGAPPARNAAVAALVAHRGLLLEATAVLVGFAILAVAVTWPVARDFDTLITSDGLGWDPAGYVWEFWFNAREGLQLWGSGTREILSAPFGQSLAASSNSSLLLTYGPAWAVAQLAGPVVAYNVTALSGLVLSAASVYLLVRWLGIGPAPAAWAGVAAMLAPYELLRVTLHVPFAHIECFALLLLAGIAWLQRPSALRALWMVLALALAWITTPYYGLAASVMALAIGVVGVVRIWRDAGAGAAVRRAGEAAGLALALVVVPLYALLESGRDAIEDNFTRPRESLALYGARLRDYVVPDGNNAAMDWLLGDARWAQSAAPGGERTVFLGWVAIALALAGVALVARRWGEVAQRVRLAVLLGVVLTPLLVWFSLASPTTIGGVGIPVPSEAVYDLVPTVRAYARFGIAVLVVVVVLGAIGLAQLVRGRGRAVVWGAAAVAAVGSVALTAPELPIVTARPVTIAGADPRDAPSWRWLADGDRRDGIVFEYPTGTNAYGPQFELVERVWQYGQTVHGRPLLNGGFTPGELGYDFTRNVLRPEWPGVASQLAGAGVSTVVVNPWAAGVLGQPPIDPAAPPQGFAPAASFPDGTAAWHVVAPPPPASAIFRGTWSGPEASGGRLWWTAPAIGGRISVVGWRPGTYRFTFLARLAAPAPGARLRLRPPGGPPVSVPLGAAPRAVSVEVRAPGLPDPPATIVASTPGAPPGAVRVSAPEVAPAR